MIENKFNGKFVFVEHKPKEELDSNKDNKEVKKDIVYFRVCVPDDKTLDPYLDVFCPFSPCTNYSIKHNKI
jgi:hypothetical protein